MNRFISLVIIVMMTAACASQQERAERITQAKTAVTEMIEKKHWRINVTSMNTMRYGARTVTPDFFLELRGDTLQSYLPYLGQAYQAPLLSPSEGLNFETVVRSYQVSRKKAHSTEIAIHVKTIEDSYRYTITIFDTGKASIHVRPQHRDPISFDGDCESISF